MMVLKHAYIVVPHGNLIIHVDKEDVVDAWVLEVVQGRGNYAAHLLEAVQLELVFHATLSHEIIKRLADIRSVRLIVISYTFISRGKMSHEVHQFIEIDIIGRYQAMLSK